MESIDTALVIVIVIVVVGSMGSIPVAFLAAVLISELKALCIAIGNLHLFGMDFAVPKLTLVVESLVMVLLGGIQTLIGPIAGAPLFTWLHDSIARETEYWKAVLGLVVLVLVLLFPAGIVGTLHHAYLSLLSKSRKLAKPVAKELKEAL
ncbi:hypothetical protein WH50_18420 [Pokkaliibacter plantistimulans]|uniref:DUF2062 domain-containing protein n=1 Tax=Pokkaliibacter plantistimulans TaxID=1635171 RepID=A0ABX5LWJ8_9GAMM|nr:hypothetical protein [Pokkaliibacter plantistimulans]PXF29873.1 hypothetical protein WH50_18420 [Pokkaliibacter plantistimulans]